MEFEVYDGERLVVRESFTDDAVLEASYTNKNWGEEHHEMHPSLGVRRISSGIRIWGKGVRKLKNGYSVLPDSTMEIYFEDEKPEGWQTKVIESNDPGRTMTIAYAPTAEGRYRDLFSAIDKTVSGRMEEEESVIYGELLDNIEGGTDPTARIVSLSVKSAVSWTPEAGRVKLRMALEEDLITEGIDPAEKRTLARQRESFSFSDDDKGRLESLIYGIHSLNAREESRCYHTTKFYEEYERNYNDIRGALSCYLENTEEIRLDEHKGGREKERTLRNPYLKGDYIMSDAGDFNEPFALINDIEKIVSVKRRPGSDKVSEEAKAFLRWLASLRS